MKGETVNITHLCKFGWYDWVYLRDNAVTYPNDKWVLGTWLGPQFKDNGRCVYRSSYRHLTEDEPNRLEEKKKKESYDQLIHSKLGSPELQRTLKRIIQLLSMSCMKMMIGMVFLMPGNARMNQLPSHMTHILVLKINVNIDCKFNEVPNLLGEKDILDCNTRQSVALFVCFLKIVVCKDDDFSVLTDYKFINENIEKCTMMYRAAMGYGIDCYNNQTLLIWLVTTIFDWMGLNCYI